MRRTVWILALAAGYVDGLALLYLGGVFASVVTGNLLLVGITAATDPHHLAGTAGRAALAVAVYATTVAAARNIPPARCLIAELAALCTLTGGWVATHHDPHGAAELPLLTLAVIAVALQAASQRDGDTPTGHLTGPLIRVAEGRIRLAGDGAPLIAMPAGAAAAALLLDRAPWLGPLPAVALVAAAVVLRAVPPRKRRPRASTTPQPEPAWTP
ncbi:YoaK family protein [Dactylosporangium sp. NPDC049140]|uniref:YoaK family protein n=1 Tax=Dactylosporangium sp. NPDC049140 TaxID=3155647 RepID=UPI0033F10B5C